MNSLLCTEALVYSAGQRTLIDKVSLRLEPGEMVALIGPNGAGKSTLLRLLTGFLPPTAGRCLLDGQPLAAWPAQTLSRRRAVMRQQAQLGFDWPVEDVIAMGRAPWEADPDPALVRELMQLTGCATLAGRSWQQLSGGEQQRVQLARTLAQLWRDGQPEGYLFLDEPTSALDLYHQQHLLRLLQGLTRQAPLHVCMVLHDLNLAALWADRLLLLHEGQLVSQGSPETVLQAPVITRWYGADVQVGQHPSSPAPQVFLTR